MKEVIMNYEKCRDILLKECEMIQNARTEQEKIRLAVMNREWTDFENHFKTMNGIECELVWLENERENLLNEFKRDSNENDSKSLFYAMASRLPEEQRNDLTAIYRSLKLESIKLRMANDALMNYLAGIKGTLTDFFSLAFPDRGGKMYTPKGTHFSHDMRSMVLNQSF